MELGKLPLVIRNSDFDEKGFVRTQEGILVPAYVGSQKGFNPNDKGDLAVFYEQLRKRKVLALCPFKACEEYLDFSKVNDDMTVREAKAFWDDFNRTAGAVNYGILMPYSKFMIAILDGSHACDDGVCAEIGYYAARHNKPIVGIRGDMRLAENIAAPINPAVRYFMDKGPYNGLFFSGPSAYDDALDGIEKLAEEILNQSN